MLYFKKSELAETYHIAEKTVTNWIKEAKAGKLALELHEEGGKAWIANTTRNIILMEELVKDRKKYRNSRGAKILAPAQKFYESYTKRQIFDIVSSLANYKEIPLQYGYMDGGAESWDKYADRLSREQTPNILTMTAGLLDMQAAYIDSLIKEGHKVNIIDLGPGNGLPLYSTIKRLHQAGLLNKYVAIDISNVMLSILEKNVQEWFGGEINAEYHVRNFMEERFDDIFIDERIANTNNPIVNVVFLLGGTLSNTRLPDHMLEIIHSSLSPGDLFVYSGYLDTPYTRRYFDLSGADYNQKDPQQSGLIPSMWHLDETICDYELLFSKENHCRLKRMVPKVDLSIKLNIEGETCVIELLKGEPIILWRHQHYSSLELTGLLDKNGFDVMQTTKTKSGNYVVLISRIKTTEQN